MKFFPRPKNSLIVQANTNGAPLTLSKPVVCQSLLHRPSMAALACSRGVDRAISIAMTATLIGGRRLARRFPWPTADSGQ